jgi:hypothetical protein
MNGMFGIMEEMKRSIVRISDGQVELEKKIEKITIKIGQGKEERETAEKRNVCSRGKGKGKRKKESSNDDEERGNYPNDENTEEKDENEELIDMLRDQRGMKFSEEGKTYKKFNWIEEIENIWRLIRRSNEGMAKCKEAARSYVCRLKGKYSFNCPSKTDDPKDPRTIVKRSREPLLEKLCKAGHVPHPFILQCIKGDVTADLRMKMVLGII